MQIHDEVILEGPEDTRTRRWRWSSCMEKPFNDHENLCDVDLSVDGDYARRGSTPNDEAASRDGDEASPSLARRRVLLCKDRRTDGRMTFSRRALALAKDDREHSDVADNCT